MQEAIRNTQYAIRKKLSRLTFHACPPKCFSFWRVSRISSPKGFTLIELLVVISIFGLLASLILANFNATRERARDLERKSDLDQIKKALRLYYNDNRQYPEGDSNNDLVACGGGPSACDWGSSWDNGMTYMKILSQDPNYDSATGTPTYSYQEVSGNEDFCLWATLENASDADITQSHNRCSDCSVGVGDYVVCAD